MSLKATAPELRCPECGAAVPVRRADAYREGVGVVGAAVAEDEPRARRRFLRRVPKA
jgi:hypothetical protein